MTKSHQDRGVTRHKPQLCPYCGYTFDAASTADGSDGAPTEGAAGVCLNCAEVMVFDSRLAVRKLTLDELTAMENGVEEWADARRERAKLKVMQGMGFKTKQAERGLGRPQ